ncbi:MAG: hypothetical protein IT307_04620, partial [Chloroflexi bacterium]|nr:hypothetical protein [Chloroflexota bacterium]
LTQQIYHSVVDVFVTSYRRTRMMINAKILFHRRKPTAFEVGLTRREMDGVKLVVSDPERTVLDALDHPPLVGDMSAAIAHFKNALPRIDPARLADYALRLAADSTCQRLGLLLERAEVSGPFMADLRQRALRSTGQHLLVPGYPRSGPLHPIWRVVENDPQSSVSVHEQW